MHQPSLVAIATRTVAIVAYARHRRLSELLGMRRHRFSFGALEGRCIIHCATGACEPHSESKLLDSETD